MTMYNCKVCSALAIVAFLCAYSPNSRADCVANAQDVAPDSLDDQVHTRFMNMSDQNRQDFIDTFCHEYLNYSCYYFKGYGWSNWQDSATLWAKWANAAWLINFGYISDNMPTNSDCSPDGGFCLNYNDRPWHGRTDYRRLGKACHTFAHDEFDIEYAWSNSSGGPAGTTTLGLFDHYDASIFYSSDTVELFCPLFDPVQWHDQAQPVLRAGTLVHEGQHAWQQRYYDDNWHDAKCGDNQHDCDYWNYHRRHAIPDGGLRTPYQIGICGGGGAGGCGETPTADWEHRPYQVEWEFYCDLAEHPNYPLPLDVQIQADSAARNTGSFSAANGPVPHCGSPLPNGKTPISPKVECPWTGCDSAADCVYYNLGYISPVCTAGCCQEGFIPPPPS